MSDLFSRIASLRPKNRDLLFEQLEVKQAAESEPQTAIIGRRGPGPYPLSFSQQRLWFLDQLEPGAIHNNDAELIRINGPLNVRVLEQSLNEIVRRHEILRTTFAFIDERPVQVVADSLEISIPTVDMRGMPGPVREDMARRLAIEESLLPFDLARGPLLRCTLVQMDEEDYILLLICHLIISDRWSKNLLVYELMEHYDRFSNRRQSQMPDLPVQYADYAIWQHEYLRGETLEQLLSYWRKKLAAELPTLELPTDLARRPAQTYVGGTETNILPGELAGAVRVLYQSEEATFGMMMLAVWDVLLHRYTAQEDIIIGTVIATRNRPEIERLIGSFVNTLPMRTDLSGNPTFRELLRRVKTVMLDAYAHQDLPFEKLLEELHPERKLSHNTLFQISLDLQNQSLPALQVNDLTFSLTETNSDLAMSDMTLYAWEPPDCEPVDDGLATALVYNKDLFYESTAARMIKHFQCLLESIVADPDQRLSSLQILTEAERQQIVAWNDTDSEYPQNTCVHYLFQSQVERTPDNIAVVYEQSRLTYRELNSRANQLAHYLMKLGAKPEMRVGVLLERSVEMLVAVMGILKAGAAYVPLDVSYPASRILTILEDAQVKLLVTSSDAISGESGAGVEAVRLDLDWEKISQESDANPVSSVKPENLAYVIYTSGSTGKPKGGMVQHNTVPNLLAGFYKAIYARHKGAHLRISMNGPLAFDTSVKQIIQLLHGHTLYIVPQEVRFDENALLSYMERNKLHLFDCTPSHLKLLIQAGLLSRSGLALTDLLLGGEPIDEPTWSLLANHPSISFFNLYGPTECTVCASACLIPSHPHRPTIGHPITNVRIHILDHYLRHVPAGVPGQLHIAGVSVGRGYLNRPDLTADKFIPDPFSSRPGARMYRTGDVVRYLADGSIDFIGRVDHQVKIRGYRIELGEIEASLNRHSAVRESLVAVREDVPGEKRLVAYVIPDEGRSISISELRTSLIEKLPDYMLPSTFVILDAMPLMPNGKIDRKALPVPDYARQESERAFVAPSNPIEEMLLEIWSYLLGVERISVNDNFFHIGGHSLMATRLRTRISEIFEVTIPLKRIFDKPTIAEIGKAIEEIMIAEVSQFSEQEARQLLEGS